MNIHELKQARADKLAQMKAVTDAAKAEGRELTDDEAIAVDAAIDSIEGAGGLDEQIQAAEKKADRAAAVDRLMQPAAPEPRAIVDRLGDIPAPRVESRIPRIVQANSGRRLKSFKGEKFGKSAAHRAYDAGMFFLATIGRNQKAADYCRLNGIPLGYQNESDNAQGGFLVFDELDMEMIDLREQYGVFRRNARVVPMSSETSSRIRRTGGLTSYFVGEDGSGTSSTATWDRVNLTAKERMVLGMMTNSVAEDAVIDLADWLTSEIAYAFSVQEDDCGFNGDGTSTYGGIVGVRSKFTNLDTTIANIAGLVVGAGNAYSELTLANFNDVVGKLPLYARARGMAKWYVSSTFYGSVMQKLQYAAGGATIEGIGGGTGPSFLGFPVELSQSMPATEGNSQVCAILGDLALAADFGDRRGTTISFSDSATVDSISTFQTNQTAFRGTSRFDINVHDVGNASSTAASRVTGPVVGLITAAS